MENEIKNKWLNILEYLKNEFNITDVSYKTWILPLKLYSVDEENNTAIIAVNVNDVGQMGITHIVNKYNLFLQISIEEITGYHLTLSFINSSELYSEDTEKEKKESKPNKNININLNEKYKFDTFIVGKNNSLAHAAALCLYVVPKSR